MNRGGGPPVGARSSRGRQAASGMLPRGGPAGRPIDPAPFRRADEEYDRKEHGRGARGRESAAGMAASGRPNPREIRRMSDESLGNGGRGNYNLEGPKAARMYEVILPKK